MQLRYQITRSLFAIALRVFFGRLVVEGEDRIPKKGGALIVANHTNGLVDGLLFLCLLKRPVCIVVKAALRSSSLIRFLLWMINAEVVYRSQDDSSSEARAANQTVLAKLADRVLHGELVCIFPEGKSHSEPSLLKFHSGPALIIQYVWEKDVAPPIIPVALLYDAKSCFRSSVILRVLSPIVESEVPHQARALTAEFKARLATEVPQFTTQEQQKLGRWIAELFAAEIYGSSRLGEEHQRERKFFELLQRCSRSLTLLSDDNKKNEILKRLLAYRQQLEDLGFDLREAFVSISPLQALVFLIRELEILFIGGLFASLGIVLNALPYLGTRVLVRLITKDEDQVATHAVFFGLAIFLIFWILLALLMFLFFPTVITVSAIICYCYLSTVALLFLDRVSAAYRRTKTFLRLINNSKERKSLQAAVEDLRFYLISLEKELCH